MQIILTNLAFSQGNSFHINDIKNTYIAKTEVDAENNIIAVGLYWNNPTNFYGHDLPVIQKGSVFICKYDQNGNFIWVKYIEGFVKNDFKILDNRVYPILGLTTDENSNIYMTGIFENELNFNGTQTIVKHDSVSQEIYLIKLDKNGDLVWHQTMVENGNARSEKITVYHDKLFIPIVTRHGEVTLSINGITINTFDSGNCVLTCLDTNGNLNWYKQFGTGGSDEVNSIEIYGDHIYMTGFLAYYDLYYDNKKLADRNTINGTIYLFKLDMTGNLIWLKTIGGSAIEKPNEIKVSENEIFMSGLFRSVFQYSQNFNFANKAYQSNSESVDAFLIKMDTSGKDLGFVSIGGNKYDLAYSMDIDQNNNITVGGKFYSDSLLSGIYNLDYHDYSTSNMFLLQFDENLNLKGAFTSVLDSFDDEIMQVNNMSDYTLVAGNFNYYECKFFGYTMQNYPGYFLYKIKNENLVEVQAEAVGNLNVYPNPAQNKLYVSLPQANQNGELYLYDFQGKLLKSYKINDDENRVEIDISNFSSSLLVIKFIEQSGATFTQKVMKY